MMFVHALLKILIGFSWSMLTSGSVIFYGLAISPWLIVNCYNNYVLELLIAFLQVYVFVVLIAIYINDVTTEH